MGHFIVDTVSSSLHRATGKVDEVKYAAYVTKQTAQIKRYRDKGRRDFASLTDAECVDMAAKLCSMYRHQFNIYAPAEPR